jgi:hypothetical protein
VSEKGLDKQIEQLGIREILTTLCPGVLFLSSLLLWFPVLRPAPWADLISSISTLPVSIIILVLSYAIGIILNAWSAEGFVAFVRLRDLRKVRKGFRKALTSIHFLCLALFHGREFASHTIGDVSARMEIYEFVRAQYGESVVALLNPNNLMPVFRVLVWDEVGRNGRFALEEASSLAQRRVFGEVVALSAMVIAIEACVEIVFLRFFPVGPKIVFSSLLGGLAIVGGSGSIILRRVASKLSAEERIITFAILKALTRKTPIAAAG